MGLMIDGQGSDDDRIPSDGRGYFVRAESRFRHWITADGSAGPSGEGGFKADGGRYHPFVAPSRPWAHRSIIMRKLNAALAAVEFDAQSGERFDNRNLGAQIFADLGRQRQILVVEIAAGVELQCAVGKVVSCFPTFQDMGRPRLLQ